MQIQSISYDVALSTLLLQPKNKTLLIFYGNRPLIVEAKQFFSIHLNDNTYCEKFDGSSHPKVNSSFVRSSKSNSSRSCLGPDATLVPHIHTKSIAIDILFHL